MSSFKKDVFGEGGLLHRAFGAGYEVRHEQVNMSVATAKAILKRDVLLGEGATGVGKSFAYLIASVSPSIRAALKEQGYGGPIVISTSTKVLQDQVYGKDVPDVLRATQQPLRPVLVKGRQNYVSVRRLTEFVDAVADNTFQFSDHAVAETGQRIAPELGTWIETSENGEISDFGEQLPRDIRLEIESTDQDCQGKACDFYGECRYRRAKSERLSADILIVNHALLALHIGHRNVLPKACNTFIIDEAHKFYESVSGVFEDEIKLGQVEWFLKTFRTRLGKLRELVSTQREQKAVIDALGRVVDRRRSDEKIAVDFFEAAQEAVSVAAVQASATTAKTSERFGYTVLSPSIEHASVVEMFAEYKAISEELLSAFGIESIFISDEDLPESPEARKRWMSVINLSKSALEIANRFEGILSGKDAHLWCYWSEVAGVPAGERNTPYRLSLKRTPIDISEQIAPLFAEKHSVIFTSATLQVSNSFTRVRQQLGLTGDDLEKAVSERVYPSPFPYKDNVEVHLFGNMIMDRPSPWASADEKEAYTLQQAQLTEYYIRSRGGRALVLCSSNNLLHELSERLEPVLEYLGINVFKQTGTDRLKETVASFKSDETSVLFGVASCWEGLDAPGSTLETVIIPQLPFAPPHPLIEARKALLNDPDNWFSEISLPDMLLHLKQGAGRLVRSMTDRGVIAILSPRPLTKAYGRAIRHALPPGRLVRNCSEALETLKRGETC
ncbi:MAG: hypothetical protein OXL96_13980 [Candidatus Poribacteria bacterium]|nr:hypothetical protein [Candidatus Poribacteria bacterium]